MRLFTKRFEHSRAAFPRVDVATLMEPAARHQLLAQLHTYVESFAAEQSHWYMHYRSVRQTASLWIRFFSLTFLFLGGLCPLIPKNISSSPVQDYSPWGYVLIGIGGGLLLFDRLFGISSSWMRYVWTAFQINELLDDFRLRWMKAELKATDAVTSDTFDALITIADDAIKGIHALVLLETNAWRAEFQSNITHQMTLWKSQADGHVSANARVGKGGYPNAHKS